MLRVSRTTDAAGGRLSVPVPYVNPLKHNGLMSSCNLESQIAETGLSATSKENKEELILYWDWLPHPEFVL